MADAPRQQQQNVITNGDKQQLLPAPVAASDLDLDLHLHLPLLLRGLSANCVYVEHIENCDKLIYE